MRSNRFNEGWDFEKDRIGDGARDMSYCRILYTFIAYKLSHFLQLEVAID